MAAIYIRTLPNGIYERLQERAKRHRRSVTQEAAVILEETLGKPERLNDVWEEIDRLRERLRSRYGTFQDSTPLLREDRKQAFLSEDATKLPEGSLARHLVPPGAHPGLKADC